MTHPIYTPSYYAAWRAAACAALLFTAAACSNEIEPAATPQAEGKPITITAGHIHRTRSTQ